MTARPDSWMKFYPADYMADTMHLSAAESGAYLHLICAYWRNGGPLRLDDDDLRRQARMERDEWAAAKGRVLALFTAADGRLSHKRIDAEIAEATESYDRRCARTRAATEARKAAAERNDERNDARNDGRNVAEPEPEPEPEPESIPPSAAKPGAVSRPDDSAAEPPPLKTRLFGECLQWLGRAAGRDPNSFRPLVGRWCREFGEEPVLRAFLRAQRDGPVEPVAWITAALKTETGVLNGNRSRRSAAQSPEDRDRAIRAAVFAGAFPDLAGDGRADQPGDGGPDSPDLARLARVVGGGRA